jgi:hypothetical protein
MLSSPCKGPGVIRTRSPILRYGQCCTGRPEEPWLQGGDLNLGYVRCLLPKANDAADVRILSTFARFGTQTARRHNVETTGALVPSRDPTGSAWFDRVAESSPARHRPSAERGSSHADGGRVTAYRRRAEPSVWS